MSSWPADRLILSFFLFLIFPQDECEKLDCPGSLLLLLFVSPPPSPCSQKSAEFVIHTWPAFVALPKQTHFSSLGFKPNTLCAGEEGAEEKRRVLGGWRPPGRLVNAPSHSFLWLFVSIIIERCTAHYVSRLCQLTSAGILYQRAFLCMSLMWMRGAHWRDLNEREIKREKVADERGWNEFENEFEIVFVIADN